MSLKGFISYPGASSPQSASYTCTHGIHPSVATLEITLVDGDSIALVGDLILSDGQRSITIPQCRVDKADVTADLSRRSIRLYLMDRRWQWRYGEINGYYNEPIPTIHDIPKIAENGEQLGNAQIFNDEGVIPPVQEKTRKDARALCALLLTTMKETGFDVSAVPNNLYPEIRWEAANPASELQRIAEANGLRVVLDPLSNRVRLVRLGVGQPIPSESFPGEMASDQLGIDPPEPPSKIIVYGSPIEYQVRFSLEAVGLDFDGRVKLIDDLSYKPRNGWGYLPGPFPLVSNSAFANPLPAGRTYKDAKYLADQSVYRWFRVAATLPLRAIPGGLDNFWFPVDATDYKDKTQRRFVRLLGHRADTSKDEFDNRIQQPATCYGEVEGGSLVRLMTKPGDEIRIPFNIDEERQLIQFSRYMRVQDGYESALNELGEPVERKLFKPARLTLETCCTIREKLTGEPRRYRYEFSLTAPARKRKSAKPPYDVLPIVRDDIRHWVLANYIDAIENKLNTTVTNKPECDRMAKFYAEGEARRFQLGTPQTRVFNSIKVVGLDGAIQSVAWSVSIGGVSTSVSRDSELAAVAVPYNVRQKQEETSRERLGQRDRALSRLQQRIARAKDFGQ